VRFETEWYRAGLADVPPLYDSAAFDGAMRRIGAARREKVLRFKNARRAAQSLACELLLADMLTEMDLHTVPEIAVTERGKPYFLNVPELSFGFAHSGERAVVAISRTAQIGVDIERVRPIARRELRIFTDAQRAELAVSENADLTFARLWTRHESAVKAFGAGVFERVTPSRTDTRELDGYVVSVSGV
jgi:4'-phosphopantetheinyl transferase